MKRFTAWMIALLLTLNCSLVLADDVYEKEILFRGIEWKSNYATAEATLGDIKIRDLRTNEYWYPMEEYMYDPSNHLYKGDMGAYTYANSSSIKDLKVAGYEVEDLYLYFVYLPGEDGILIRDKDHTALFYAYYKLEPKDPDAVYADLVEKLTGLYGDVDDTNSGGSIINYEQSLWNGANGTMVSVMREDYSSGNHYIYIKYGSKVGDELIEQAYNAIVLEETKNAASNTDGL